MLITRCLTGKQDYAIKLPNQLNYRYLTVKGSSIKDYSYVDMVVWAKWHKLLEIAYIMMLLRLERSTINNGTHIHSSTHLCHQPANEVSLEFSILRKAQLHAESSVIHTHRNNRLDGSFNVAQKSRWLDWWRQKCIDANNDETAALKMTK